MELPSTKGKAKQNELIFLNVFTGGATIRFLRTGLIFREPIISIPQNWISWDREFL
jgi:hypothetical protein